MSPRPPVPAPTPCSTPTAPSTPVAMASSASSGTQHGQQRAAHPGCRPAVGRHHGADLVVGRLRCPDERRRVLQLGSQRRPAGRREHHQQFGPRPRGPAGPVVQVIQGGIVAKNGQTLAILANSSLWAWGNGQWGQLGNWSRSSSTTPIAITLPSGAKAASVASGGFTSYAIDTSGRLWPWGRSDDGQLGTGDSAPFSLTPVPIGRSSFRQVSSTAQNVAGLSRVDRLAQHRHSTGTDAGETGRAVVSGIRSNSTGDRGHTSLHKRW